MKKRLKDYEDIIKKLPFKNKYTKEELLTKDFLIEKHGDLEIYYATHNEHINPNAKVFIVGITPGFQQMSTAIKTARMGFEEGLDLDEIAYNCKSKARFTGPLRNNIIKMLDELGLNKALKITSCNELFRNKDFLLHTVSLIPYPVFLKGKNYSGHTPKLIKCNFLMKYVYEDFIDELKELDSVLIIPLGRAVEEALDVLIDEKIISEKQVLKGFPHPSGANAHRWIQFEENKENMMRIIKEYKNLIE